MKTQDTSTKLDIIHKQSSGRVIMLAVLVALIAYSFALPDNEEPVQNITPPEGVNSPMGIARGSYPGRVAWMQDFNATRWDGVTGQW